MSEHPAKGSVRFGPPLPIDRGYVVIVGNPVDGFTFYYSRDANIDPHHHKLADKAWSVVELKSLDD